MIGFSNKGSWGKTEKFLKSSTSSKITSALEAHGRAGLSALQSATPVETGLSGSSWSYDVKKNRGGYALTYYNSQMAGGVPLVILIQYGHATGTGGYVQGRDFINPALRPIFDKIANQTWRAVTSA